MCSSDHSTIRHCNKKMGTSPVAGEDRHDQPDAPNSSVDVDVPSTCRPDQLLSNKVVMCLKVSGLPVIGAGPDGHEQCVFELVTHGKREV